MIAIDMEMPGACCACDFEWSNFMEDKVCMIVNTGRGGREIDIDSATERPDWCPLHEVKFTDEFEPKGAKTV